MDNKKNADTDVHTIGIAINNALEMNQLDHQQKILLPSGLIGFSGYHSYYISHVPYKNLENFKTLRSCDNPKIAFLVLQIDAVDSSIMNAADLDFVAELMNVSLKDLQVLFVARPEVMECGKYNITLNTKAPIFVDKVHNIAMQYVLQSAHYNIRQRYYKEVTQEI